MKKKAKRKPRRAIRQYDGKLWLCVRVPSYLRKRPGYKRRIRVKAYWRKIRRVKRKREPGVEKEHRRLVEDEPGEDEGPSPRIEHIERVYCQRVRDGIDSMKKVIENLALIATLTDEERRHIIRHVKALTTLRGAK